MEPEVPKPAAPSDLTVKLLPGSRLQATWKDNSSNETGFKLRARVGGAEQTLSLPAGQTSFTTSELPLGLYTLDVCATNASGDSAYTRPVTVQVVSDPPAPSPAPPAPQPTPAPTPPAPSPPLPAPTPIPVPATGEWTVEANGRIYRQAGALDQGGVQTFGAHQRSQVVAFADSGLRVIFRPEVDGSRMEIVFEYGRIFSADVATIAYSYIIKRGDTEVARGSVTHHLHARWRWQSASRSIGDINRAGIFLPVFRPLGQDLPAQSYQPMDLAGFVPDMGTTGERPDIGLVTEWCAQYMARGNNLQTIRAQAEASGSMPWHFRDERTGRAIDLAQYPNASVDSRGNPSPLIKTALVNVRLEEAHMPEFLLVPYLLTGDPYYLEALQFQALWMYLSHPADAYRDYLNQSRAAAWTLRTTGLALLLTPVASGWLMPKAVLQARLDAKRVRLEKDRALYPGELAAPVPWTEGSVTVTAPWMDDFLTAVLCWLVLMGRSEFISLAQWRWESTRKRGMGQGIPRAYATAYRYVVRPTLAESFAASGSVFGLTATGDDYAFGDWAYLSYLGGAAVLADKLGYPDAAAVAAWVDEQFLKAGQPRTFKWSLA